MHWNATAMCLKNCGQALYWDESEDKGTGLHKR